MRITKRQLRRIIKEEKTKVLAEQKVRRIVRRKLMEQAQWEQASDLLSKLQSNPRDSKTLDQIMTMVQGLGETPEVDMAVDALLAVEDAESPDEMADAADYAVDYVRDAFDTASKGSPGKAGEGPKDLLSTGFYLNQKADGGPGIGKALGVFVFEDHPDEPSYTAEELAELTGTPIPSTGDTATDGIMFLKALESKGLSDGGYSSVRHEVAKLQYGDAYLPVPPAFEYWKDSPEDAPFEWDLKPDTSGARKIAKTPEGAEFVKKYGVYTG
jgi:hypothetical protein